MTLTVQAGTTLSIEGMHQEDDGTPISLVGRTPKAEIAGSRILNTISGVLVDSGLEGGFIIELLPTVTKSFPRKTVLEIRFLAVLNSDPTDVMAMGVTPLEVQ